jgi:hypothetical protein
MLQDHGEIDEVRPKQHLSGITMETRAPSTWTLQVQLPGLTSEAESQCVLPFTSSAIGLGEVFNEVSGLDFLFCLMMMVQVDLEDYMQPTKAFQL